MVNDFGLSFSPLNSVQGYQNPNQGGLTPVQEAVQILSLRRPTLTGVAPVSNALFNAPASPTFGALLQTLMQQFGASPWHQPRLPRTTDNGFPPGPTMPTPQSLPTPSVDYTNQGPRTNTPGTTSPMPAPPSGSSPMFGDVADRRRA